MNLTIQERPRPKGGEELRDHIENEPSFPIDALSSELSFAKANGPLFGDLVSLSRCVLGDEDLAWDAVQESFLSLWLGGTAPDNLRGWLKSAVIRRSLHLARCRARRRRRESLVTQERPEPSDRDDPRRSIEARELAEIIMSSVLAINPEFREVLVLSLDDQMDYASIAQRLGVPIGTVRSRLSRARRALRAVLMRALPEDYRRLLPTEPV